MNRISVQKVDLGTHAMVQSRVIPQSQCAVRHWSGGETTELALFPPGASFNDRTFLARISTASVRSDGPFSDFTGYQRILMLLSGEGMDLEIGGVPYALARPFDTCSFDGAAKVSAKLRQGEVRDFNVIHRPEVQAHVDVLGVGPTQTSFSDAHLILDASLSVSKIITVMFAWNSPVSISIAGQKLSLNPGDVAELTRDTAHDAATIDAISASGPGEIIRVLLAL